MRWLVVALVCLLGACAPREPTEAELLRALRRHHEDWAAAQRRQTTNTTASPLVNLPFQAALTLNIHGAQKERCQPAVTEPGFICMVSVEASTAYAPHLRRRIEARFVEGTRGWLALSPRSLDPVTNLPLLLD